MGGGRTAKSEIRVFESFPLLVIEFVGAPDDRQFAEYISNMEAIMEHRASQGAVYEKRSAVIIDTTEATRPATAPQRKMQADLMRRARAKYKDGGEAETAVCFVITNTLVRGVLTAVLWLQPVRQRYRVFATRAQADSYAKRWLAGLNSLAPGELGHG